MDLVAVHLGGEILQCPYLLSVTEIRAESNDVWSSLTGMQASNACLRGQFCYLQFLHPKCIAFCKSKPLTSLISRNSDCCTFGSIPSRSHCDLYVVFCELVEICQLHMRGKDIYSDVH